MKAQQGDAGSPHQAVLLTEAVDALVQDIDGSYVDATFGRGGHSAEILRRLGAGRLVAIDRDPVAIEFGRQRFAQATQIELVHAEFSQLKSVMVQRAMVGDLNGVLLDLGVSSPQLDEASRGFSFMREGPLDMRMNPATGPSAAQWLNSAPETEIADVIFQLGEERLARRIARAVVAARVESPLQTTTQLADLVKTAVPAYDQGKHPATRTFQAIRLHVNSELSELRALLAEVLDLLAPGGRLVVISFHSLEDRIVKNFMRDASRTAALPKEIPLVSAGGPVRLRLVGKPIKPSAAETAANPRARSAIMRVAEKVA